MKPDPIQQFGAWAALWLCLLGITLSVVATKFC